MFKTISYNIFSIIYFQNTRKTEMSRRDAGTKIVPTVLKSLVMIYFPTNNVLYDYVLCLRLFYYILSTEIVEKSLISITKSGITYQKVKILKHRFRINETLPLQLSTHT